MPEPHSLSLGIEWLAENVPVEKYSEPLFIFL